MANVKRRIPYSELLKDPDLDSVLFRYMMEHITDAVYFKDVDSKFITLSNAHLEKYGIEDLDVVIGKSDFDFFTEEHARQAYEDEQKIIDTGVPLNGIEEKETYEDGTITWVSTSKLPLRNKNGEIIGTFGISRDITDKKIIQQALIEREEKLRQQNDAMQRDLERARMIQREMLPKSTPEHPRLNVEYRCQPVETIGGDYYCFAPQKDNGLGVFIGDLTGHGVSAALFMALVRFLSDRLNGVHGLHPKLYLQNLNALLIDRMPSAFLTAIYGFCSFPNGIDPADGDGSAEFIYSAAGHTTPLCWRKAEGRIEKLRLPGNAALGVIEEFDSDEVMVHLNPGDRLFFYTDGLIESMDLQQNELGEDGFIELCEKTQDRPLSESLDAILDGATEFRCGKPCHDDILLIAFELT